MTTAETVLAVAETEVGYVEQGGPDGKSGNITKYWAELDPAFQGQPWCAAFQRWVNIHAKSPDLPVANPYYCPSLVTYAKQHGLWDESGHYSPADLVFWDFSGQGVAEHVGRIVSDNGTSVICYEGNTSSGIAGSQANGGGVYQRTRNHGPQLLGVLKYSKLLDIVSAIPVPGPNVTLAENLKYLQEVGFVAPRNPVKANPFGQFASFCNVGSKGNQVRFVQWAVGVPVDGVFGPQTEYAVKQFQRYHGLAQDGVVGPLTISRLRSVTH